MAPIAEMASVWRLARSPELSERPISAMTKTAMSIKVAVSRGSRAAKRITPSRASRAPSTIASPRTSSALAKIEPISENLATTTSPAERAKITTKNSGRLPSVDCITPVTAGPKRSPTCSVAKETTHAMPASAPVAARKAATGGAPAKCSAPASAVTAPAAASIASSRPLMPQPRPRLLELDPQRCGPERGQIGMADRVGVDLPACGDHRLHALGMQIAQVAQLEVEHAGPAHRAQGGQGMGVLARVAVVEREDDGLGGQESAAMPGVPDLLEGHTVIAASGERVHLGAEVRRRHPELGQGRVGPRGVDDVIHEDRHGLTGGAVGSGRGGR